jgi:hypothetical protein
MNYLTSRIIAKDAIINSFLCSLERTWITCLNAKLFPRRYWFVAPQGIAYNENGYYKIGGTFWM